MNSKKSTGRALLTSVISLMLCLAMLVGTTYAWFTDSVSSSGNIITSGTLDVEMYWAKGTEDPAKVEWTDVESEQMFDYTLWEPGYTEARHIKIKNIGTLALKYQLKIIPDGDIGALADVIDVYYSKTAVAVSGRDVSAMTKIGTLTEFIKNGASTTITGVLDSETEIASTIVLKMNESAGNEYQGQSVGAGFTIKLIATQASVENDSFGNGYDANAQYPTSTSTKLTLTSPYKDFTLATQDANASTVSGTAALARRIADSGVTELILKVSEPLTDGDTVIFETVGLYDADGNEVSLDGNTESMTVKLYVGIGNAGKNVSIMHDGELVAVGTVDTEGYITYQATHFCTVSVKALAEGETPDSVISDGESVDGSALEEMDPLKLVQMLVGNHYYTVSAGMASSWSKVNEQIKADIYVPEDLLAYSMMYKNADLSDGGGSHSTLTIKNDLDFSGKTWEPIGRFYTDIKGEGKKISNLPDSLLGCVYDCQIYDLTLENVSASGSAAGVIAKELAGDIFIEGVTIAGKNTVSYVADSKSNWPEGGIGIGAICGVSLIGYSGNGNVNVTVTGTVDLNYNDIVFGNTTNCDNIGVSKEFGINIYKSNDFVNVTVDGGAINTVGNCYLNIADGLDVTVNSLSERQNAYLVSSADGLAELNGMMIDKAAGKNVTVDLLADIDMTGKTWTPVDSHADTKFTFNGINGNGHTISNMTINGQAMFTRFAGGSGVTVEINNLTFDNATVNCANKINVSILTVQSYQNVVLDNVDVKNSSITGKYKVAPLIATVYNENPSGTITATLRNCDVENVTVKATTYDFCTTGMVAFVYESDGEKIEFENCTVTDVTLIAPHDGYQSHAWIYVNDADTDDKFNEASGVTVTNCTFKPYLDRTSTFAGGTLYVADGTYVTAGEGENALTITGDTTLVLEGSATLGGGKNGSGIMVNEGVTLTVIGDGDLTVYGNAEMEYETTENYTEYSNLTEYIGTGGSGIGLASGASVVVDGLRSLVAEGYGVSGFGIGGNGASVTLRNVDSIKARGGFVNVTGEYIDAKYNKYEPEGGAAIGGATIVIDNCHIISAIGGSKAAGIGARFHQSTDITIKDCVIDEVIGGASSAAIGGSRVSDDGASGQNTVITIIDSTVNAQGGYFGAGIGSGYDTYCHTTDAGSRCEIYISGDSVITAKGGKYAAGVGTGYHNGNLSGKIESSVTVNAVSGEKFYKDTYTQAQDVGFGVTDPAREGKDNTSSIIFGEEIITIPEVTG